MEGIQRLKENLEKRGFKASAFSTSEEAVAYLCEKIKGTSVGIGGSVTVKEIGLFPRLLQNNEVWWHNDAGQLAALGDVEIRRRAAEAKVYVSSVNGVSLDGILVNIDGRGNRVAATLYGHEKVYFIVGINKLADSLEGAISRARNIAAPQNAKRLGLKTPCALSGDKCYDCNSPQRICRAVVLLERPTNGQEVEVILINEALGY